MSHSEKKCVPVVSLHQMSCNHLKGNLLKMLNRFSILNSWHIAASKQHWSCHYHMSQMFIYNWITFMMVSLKVGPFASHFYLSHDVYHVYKLRSSPRSLSVKQTNPMTCIWQKKGELTGELDSWKEYIQKCFRMVHILLSSHPKGALLKRFVMKKIETKWKILKNGGISHFHVKCQPAPTKKWAGHWIFSPREAYFVILVL